MPYILRIYGEVSIESVWKEKVNVERWSDKLSGYLIQAGQSDMLPEDISRESLPLWLVPMLRCIKLNSCQSQSGERWNNVVH